MLLVCNDQVLKLSN